MWRKYGVPVVAIDPYSRRRNWKTTIHVKLDGDEAKEALMMLLEQENPDLEPRQIETLAVGFMRTASKLDLVVRGDGREVGVFHGRDLFRSHGGGCCF